MLFQGMCMVVLTHRSPVVHPSILEQLGTVPYIVSTDNPVHRYDRGVYYVEHPPFDRTEDRIGHHVRVAINRVFSTFDWCSVVLLVEEDARPSGDFGSVVAQTLPFMINKSYHCFTSMNWAWHDEPHKWRPDRLRVVTSTFPEIVWAVTYDLWKRLLPMWGEQPIPSHAVVFWLRALLD